MKYYYFDLLLLLLSPVDHEKSKARLELEYQE